jgi:hypothetical protein
MTQKRLPDPFSRAKLAASNKGRVRDKIQAMAKLLRFIKLETQLAGKTTAEWTFTLTPYLLCPEGQREFKHDVFTFSFSLRACEGIQALAID